MKKLFLVISAILLLIIGCTTSPEIPKTTELNFFTPYQGSPEYLKGQIKSLEEMNYHAIEIDGVPAKGELLNKEARDSMGWSQNFTIQFNENGYITKIDRYYDDKDVRTWEVEYNGDQVLSAGFTRDDTLRYYYDEIVYNEVGHISSSKYIRAKDKQQLSFFKYTTNENGVWNGGTNYSAEGKKTGHYTMEQNDQNLTLASENYNKNDSLLNISQFTYNEKGFYTKAVYMNGIGDLRRTIEIEYTKYDEMGNWLEATSYADGKLFLIFEREYVYY